jgi:hypothetical protein
VVVTVREAELIDEHAAANRTDEFFSVEFEQLPLFNPVDPAGCADAAGRCGLVDGDEKARPGRFLEYSFARSVVLPLTPKATYILRMS